MVTTIEELETKARKLTMDICKPAGCRFSKSEGQAYGFAVSFPSGCTTRAVPGIIEAFQEGSNGCEYYQDEQENAGLLTPDGQVTSSPKT